MSTVERHVSGAKLFCKFNADAQLGPRSHNMKSEGCIVFQERRRPHQGLHRLRRAHIARKRDIEPRWVITLWSRTGKRSEEPFLSILRKECSIDLTTKQVA